MSFSINFNNNSTAALQTLNMTQRALGQVQNQINSGLKVANSSDNASTFAIAQTMRGDVAGLKAVSDNINLGQSTVAVAAAGVTSIQSALQDIKSKITSGQASNVDLKAIQSDIASDLSTINSTVAAAQFNSVNLLNGGQNLTVVSSVNRTAATGAGAETLGSITVTGQSLTSTSLGIASIAVAGGDAATFSLASTASLAAGTTFTLSQTVVDSSTGSTTTNTAVFEFEPSGTATTTPPIAGTGTPPTGGTSVYNVILDTTASIGTQVAALETKMQSAGYSTLTNSDGSFTVSSAGSLTLPVTTATGFAVGAVTATGFVSGTVQSGASIALGQINAAIDTSNTFNSALGTAANQLTSQGDFVTSLTNTLNSGISGLTDADLAAASASLTALQTKNQLGIQALGIANQSSSQILSLFR